MLVIIIIILFTKYIYGHETVYYIRLSRTQSSYLKYLNGDETIRSINHVCSLRPNRQTTVIIIVSVCVFILAYTRIIQTYDDSI